MDSVKENIVSKRTLVGLKIFLKRLLSLKAAVD